jgi:hypothetical protein
MTNAQSTVAQPSPVEQPSTLELVVYSVFPHLNPEDRIRNIEAEIEKWKNNLAVILRQNESKLKIHLRNSNPGDAYYVLLVSMKDEECARVTQWHQERITQLLAERNEIQSL